MKKQFYYFDKNGIEDWYYLCFDEDKNEFYIEYEWSHIGIYTTIYNREDNPSGSKRLSVNEFMNNTYYARIQGAQREFKNLLSKIFNL